MLSWLKKRGKKVAVIGLDCADPKLVFDKWIDDLPNIKGLMDNGAWGLLESTHPPITVPAWASMTTGKDPGQLGFYGFRNRKDYSYDAYSIASSADIKYNRVWDTISQNDKKCVILGVPQTYPPKAINGCVVTDFLTPSTKSAYTYPADLKMEIENVANGYVFDVANFRTKDKGALLERIYEKTKKHFKVADYLVTEKPWDFFMMVEMGVDRIHHGFWSYMDPTHPKYKAGNEFENAIRDYYKFVDCEVGKLVEKFPKDTSIMIVSDHGAKSMGGGICFNEWLIQNGYLKVKKYPETPMPLESLEIDWQNTLAWGEGGYHGRLFLNVKGREPQGVIDSKDYEGVRDEIKTKLEAICDPQGMNIGTKVYKPDEIYPIEVKGIPPDLTVYFGDLGWRSVGSVGSKSMYIFENDTGPDEANHAQHGIFILNDFGCKNGAIEACRNGMFKICDVASMILGLSGVANR